jgi:hypothetical protein
MPQPQRKKGRILLEGEVPSPMNPPSGCHFHPRCRLTRRLAGEADGGQTVELRILGETHHVMRRCVEESPGLEVRTGEADHPVACWYADQQPAGSLAQPAGAV